MINIKKLTREDDCIPTITKWMSDDAAHAGLTIDDVFAKCTEAAMVSDENGVPLMCVRVSKALRVAIQFNPKTPFKSARVAKEVVSWFKDIAKNSGCNEVIIRPGGKAVRFAEKLGFLPFIGKYLKAN
jgi:hypothetical protein